jgi:hypothetical protein
MLLEQEDELDTEAYQEVLIPKSETLNPKPQTLEPHPEFCPHTLCPKYRT